MSLDVQTLLVVTVFVTALLGALLLFAGLQNRSIKAPMWWGAAYLVGACGVALVAGRGTISDIWSMDVANAMVLASYGLIWTGARVFDGRAPKMVTALGPAILWLLAARFPLADDANIRLLLISTLMAMLAAATADEIWRGRAEPLMSRLPATLVLLAQAAALLARIPANLMTPFVEAQSFLGGATFTLLAFGALLFTVILAFLLLNMTKERTELKHKIASLVDPLTGIANRRAFLESAATLFQQQATAREPLALLLFDLDRFKEINDRFGHALGDRVLRAFADSTARTLGGDVVFGRIGGEEFAALAAVGDVGEGVAIADRVRRNFAAAATRLGSKELKPTVSVGVTLRFDQTLDMEALLEVADNALYRAKSRGRNRVEAVEGPHEGAPAVCAPSIIPIMNMDRRRWRTSASRPVRHAANS